MKKLILALFIPTIGYGQLTKKQETYYSHLADSIDRNIIDSMSKIRGTIITRNECSTSIFYRDEHGKGTSLILFSTPIYVTRKEENTNIKALPAGQNISRQGN